MAAYLIQLYDFFWLPRVAITDVDLSLPEPGSSALKAPNGTDLPCIFSESPFRRLDARAEGVQFCVNAEPQQQGAHSIQSNRRQVATERIHRFAARRALPIIRSRSLAVRRQQSNVEAQAVRDSTHLRPHLIRPQASSLRKRHFRL